MIEFKNLTEEENQIANQGLTNLEDYLNSTELNNIKFNRFFNLFNKLCLERNFDPNQLKMFDNE